MTTKYQTVAVSASKLLLRLQLLPAATCLNRRSPGPLATAGPKPTFVRVPTMEVEMRTPLPPTDAPGPLLDQHRRDIEALDRRILHLICERLELARQIGELKQITGIPCVTSKSSPRFTRASMPLVVGQATGDYDLLGGALRLLPVRYARQGFRYQRFVLFPVIVELESAQFIR